MGERDERRESILFFHKKKKKKPEALNFVITALKKRTVTSLRPSRLHCEFQSQLWNLPSEKRLRV